MTSESRLAYAHITTDLGNLQSSRIITYRVIGKLLDTKGVKMKGSGALTLTEVAGGHTEAYFHIGSKAYDYAAGTLLVRAAGGVVTDLSGKPWTVKSSDGIVAASSQSLNAEIRAAIAAVMKKGSSSAQTRTNKGTLGNQSHHKLYKEIRSKVKN